MKTVFDRLELVRCFLSTAKETVESDWIEKIFRDWEGATNSQAFCEEFADSCRRAERISDDPEDRPENIRESLVKLHVEKGPVQATRDFFISLLGGDEQDAFVLGIYLDRLVRRQDVHRYMVKPNDPASSSSIAGALQQLQVGGTSSAADKRSLADYMPRPGELKPDGSCLSKLGVLAQKCGIPGAVISHNGLTLDPSLATPAARLAHVAELDKQIREYFAPHASSCESAEGKGGTHLASSGSADRHPVIPVERTADQDKSAGGTDSVKPLEPGEYESLIAIKKTIDPENKYIGESLAILRIFEKIEQFNRTPDKPVLILGPTGSGKTEIAKYVHSSSSRKDKPFRREQAVDNAGSDATAMKGRWAGYGKGHGFPGIDQKGQPGLLHECDGGTIFIDEVGRCTSQFQTFLLGVIDQQKIPPAGGNGGLIKANVRLIFATNKTLKDLDATVGDSGFAYDLLDRIRRYALIIPALSERPEDVISFCNKECEGCKPTFKFLVCLLRYDWPGNVRELLDVLEKAIAKAQNARDLTIEHLELADACIIDEVKVMSEEAACEEVLRFLVSLLRRVISAGLQNLFGAAAVGTNARAAVPSARRAKRGELATRRQSESRSSRQRDSGVREG
ncbi:MAG: sigma-54-dependent Fis family transcriptional regulator, partial [Planctomycetaceae bacterium]|nr:sigma-54-dependent Fis family transcriptional regulator [Planctomycetaceae bacterium]